jgi:hypothetical protein
MPQTLISPGCGKHAAAVLNESEQGVESFWSQRNRPFFVENHTFGGGYPKGSEYVGKFYPGLNLVSHIVGQFALVSFTPEL